MRRSSPSIIQEIHVFTALNVLMHEIMWSSRTSKSACISASSA